MKYPTQAELRALRFQYGMKAPFIAPWWGGAWLEERQRGIGYRYNPMVHPHISDRQRANEQRRATYDKIVFRSSSNAVEALLAAIEVFTPSS